MGHRRITSVCLSGAIALGGSIANIDAQRRVPGAAAKQRIEVSLTVAGQTYQSSEPGKCTHAPTAAIYNILSELWSVQQSSDGRSLALSLWKPKDGSADMITLALSSRDWSHEINTVRGGAATSGSGKIALKKSGSGGTFTIDGRSKSGAAITGTITCDGFAPHIAEGGL